MMQTSPLTLQPSAGGAAQAQRNGAPGAGDGAQFGALLANEMEVRQPPAAPAAAPAAPKPATPKPDVRKAETPKPNTADEPARPDAATQQAAAAPEDGAKPAASGQTGDAGQDEAAADAAPAERASDPAGAMLALMASLQQPAQVAPAAATAGSAASQAFDALHGALGRGKRGETAQLATLQAALKSLSSEVATGAAVADTGAGKVFAESASLRNPALAAAGAALGADEQPALAVDADVKPGADLRAALASGAGAGKASNDTGIDLATLALQQARENAVAREPVAPLALVQAQPAVMEAVQAAAVAAGELSARVGTEAWENQVGQKVVYMVGNDEQTASLTLNPPDLGPLQVVLSITNDQASVTFSASQEAVRQALEDALPRLREMMSESGIALGNASVNAGMPDGRQAQEQAARDTSGLNGNGRAAGDGDAGADSAARPLTRTAVLGERGMVDTFA